MNHICEAVSSKCVTIEYNCTLYMYVQIMSNISIMISEGKCSI